MGRKRYTVMAVGALVALLLAEVIRTGTDDHRLLMGRRGTSGARSAGPVLRSALARLYRRIYGR